VKRIEKRGLNKQISVFDAFVIIQNGKPLRFQFSRPPRNQLWWVLLCRLAIFIAVALLQDSAERSFFLNASREQEVL